MGIKAAQAVVLCYDISDRESFGHVNSWLHQITKHSRKMDVPIVLVGCKSDLDDTRRVVSQTEGETLANDHQLPFFECSAKTGHNVAECFEACGGMVLDQMAMLKQQEPERLVPDDSPTPSCWTRFFGRRAPA